MFRSGAAGYLQRSRSEELPGPRERALGCWFFLNFYINGLVLGFCCFLEKNQTQRSYWRL